MDYKAISKAILLCGSEPSVRRCEKECPYYKGGDTKKCIPRMKADAAKAITDLLARAEAAEARASDAERALRGMIEGYFRVNEVAKKILNYSKDDNTPGYMRDDLKEASIMLFGIDESLRKAERATERAEKAERERDAAVGTIYALVADCPPEVCREICANHDGVCSEHAKMGHYDHCKGFKWIEEKEE